MAKIRQLRNALAALYPDAASARRITKDAEIDPARIDFGGSAINRWHAILGEAENSSRTDTLLKVVLDEYANNATLVAAIEAYGYPLPPKASSSSRADIKLTRSEQSDLHSALLDAFDSGALEQMLRFELGEDLSLITQGANLSEDVFRLIEWAISHGRLAELVRGACSQNPTNPKLESFCERATQFE